MSAPDSAYAKLLLTIPERIYPLRELGMGRGAEAFAIGVLEQNGHYWLSGYWHLHRARPEPPAARLDEEGREIRLDSFLPGARFEKVVALYDHELRTRLGDVLSMAGMAFRLNVSHRPGRSGRFAYRGPENLNAVRQADSSSPHEPATAYREWLERYAGG